MYLLIKMREIFWIDAVWYLHPTMYLLIDKGYQLRNVSLGFTSHYVSINLSILT